MANNYCIYCHTSPSGKCYIGQTNNIQRRWKATSYKRSPKFRDAIAKYGWDNFKHEIILDNLNKAEADQKEIEYIKAYNSIDNGYNLSPGGTGGNQKKIRPVDLYTKDGDFVGSFETANEVAIVIGCHRTQITAILNGKLASIKGYRVTDKGKPFQERPNYKKMNNHNNHCIKVFDTGKKESKIFISLKECSEYYGFNYNSFRSQFQTCKNNRYKFLIFEAS